MLRNARLFLAVVTIISTVVFPCAADEIKLYGGKVLTGKIVFAQNSDLKIDTGKDVYSVQVKQIKNIAFETTDPQLTAVLQVVEARVEKERKKKELLSEKLSRHTIEFYYRPGCPWCVKMEKFLRENNIQCIRYNIDTDRLAEKRMAARGGRGVPWIVVDGQTIISGYDPDGLMGALMK